MVHKDVCLIMDSRCDRKQGMITEVSAIYSDEKWGGSIL